MSEGSDSLIESSEGTAVGTRLTADRYRPTGAKLAYVDPLSAEGNELPDGSSIDAGGAGAGDAGAGGTGTTGWTAGGTTSLNCG